MVQNLGLGLTIERSGPLSFKIRLRDERVFHHHQDHLRLCNISDEHIPIGDVSRDNMTIPIATDVPSVQLPKPSTPVQLEGEERNRSDIEPTSDVPVVQVPPVAEQSPPVRRSVRMRKQPDYLKDYVPK
ncbi:hypothetical protein LSH36_134g05053 [Paralvinella palmiformis]|uniref:Uncharacterized protein n=1 Tax=Paralvinella palmiformis TaxID=53620 RepID=A0AAD9NAT9_9ANNE|nr:hypothetical protein LSH36_134g05053 [Paralvinella palmiformis]